MYDNESWIPFLNKELSQPYFKSILEKINTDLQSNITVYPSKKNILKVFSLPPNKIRVVILGQEPYHNGHADGLAFSSNKSQIHCPKSLQNIFKEMNTDISVKSRDKNLSYLFNQGVFLLNSILTVQEKTPLSHKSIGWEDLTKKVIHRITLVQQPMVFMLWGNVAYNTWKESTQSLCTDHILILQAAHPSPLSSHKFFGCKHFSKANNFFLQHQLPTIEW